MKTIEQKARAYDEAVNKSIEFWTLCKKCGAKDTADFLESIFPELKESEDERIRKALITYFQRFPYEGIKNAGTNPKEAIAWLEKQCEKEIEPKSDDWTENDRTILDGIIDEIEANKNEAPSYDLPTYDKFLNWLKSLKKKIINE